MEEQEKIILVDDNEMEEMLLKRSLKSLGYDIKVFFFTGGKEALEFLKNNDINIFLIISDMNMPGMNGLDFKKEIDKDPELRRKSIPFIFSSTSANNKEVCEAYDYRVQGYFYKPKALDEMNKVLDLIINYWRRCRTPNNC